MKHTSENKLKKTIAIFVMLVILFVNSSYSFVLAEEVTPTPAPQETQVQETPTTTDTPVASPTPTETSSSIPTPPTAPDAPTAPTPPSTPTTTSTSTAHDIATQPHLTPPARPVRGESQSSAQESTNNTPSATVANPSPSTGTIADGNVGTTTVKTGDATNSANITNDANSNQSASAGPSGGSGGSSVSNIGNGSDSSNTGKIVDNSLKDSIQNNTVNVINDLAQSTTTGTNSTSRNVGDSNLYSGDANTSGTITNFLNTNVNGLKVYEFNVADDHVGDLVLDFSSPTNCVYGCTVTSSAAANIGNGSGSANNANIDQNASSNTFQNNDATLENDMVLDSNSGDNRASENTSGNTTLVSGDANVSANVLNFANNNIDGNVIYAVVNIYGNLVGDIIMPDPTSAAVCGVNCTSGTTAANTGNGSGSSNTATSSAITNNNTAQFNNADIENNLSYDANTGGNITGENTNGNNTIVTGDTNVLAQTVNIANMNLVGGNYWLTLVNEAGKWIGKIVGSPDGANIATSDTLEFVVNDAGEVAVINKDNGAGSTNTANASQTSNTTTTQNNDAKIVNNINLSANSGHNDASDNTGGNTKVISGDANIVANIVNFVNNNIVGDGKLFVTVINVFGSWLGNFVGPGQKLEEHTAPSNTSTASTQQVSTTPTPVAVQSTVQRIARSVTPAFLAGRVLGTSSDNTQTGGQTSLNTSFTDPIDTNESNSYEAHVQSARSERPIVNINLAWGLLAIPAYIGFVIAKKRKLLPFPARKS